MHLVGSKPYINLFGVYVSLLKKNAYRLRLLVMLALDEKDACRCLAKDVLHTLLPAGLRSVEKNRHRPCVYHQQHSVNQ